MVSDKIFKKEREYNHTIEIGYMMDYLEYLLNDHNRVTIYTGSNCWKLIKGADRGGYTDFKVVEKYHHTYLHFRDTGKDLELVLMPNYTGLEATVVNKDGVISVVKYDMLGDD